jgi:hypothetical protein
MLAKLGMSCLAFFSKVLGMLKKAEGPTDNAGGLLGNPNLAGGG